MSAIAKPHAKFTNAINSNTVVPVDHIVSVEAVDIDALPNQPASSAEYKIAITLVYPNSATKNIDIKFATSGARNTSFTNLISLIAANVA